MGRLKEALASTGQFARDVRSELAKVHWPNRREALLYTGVVALTVVVVAAIIFVFDIGLSYGLQLVR